MGTTLVDREQTLWSAKSSLERLPVGSTSQQLFDLIAPSVGAVAGIFGSVSADGELFSGRPLRLPSRLLSSWMATPDQGFQRSLLPLTNAPEGALLLAADTVGPVAAAQMPVLEELSAEGLGAAAAVKLLQRSRGPLPAEDILLALLKGRGDEFSVEDRETLRSLYNPICEALARATLPLVSQAAILEQILMQDAVGYICISREGELLEVNRRAARIVTTFARELGVPRSRDAITEHARSMVEGGQLRRRRVLGHEQPSVISSRAYLLRRDSHVLPQDVHLIMLREESPVADLPLSRKEQVIALLLAYSSLNYEEIGQRLDIALGTVRVHVNHIYCKLNVESRHQLVEALRGEVELLHWK